MTSRELIRWSTLHERRARAGWWTSPLAVALVAGAAIAAWVAWRHDTSFRAASNTWLAACLLAFGLAFMRVPFHLYWRQDASLLAQLPIEGGPLFDAALWRCVRAGAATTLAVVIGAVPLARDSVELFARHAAIAGALGISAMLLLPASALWAAAILMIDDKNPLAQTLRATGIERGAQTSTGLLGALPGFASTVVIVFVLLVSPWATARAPVLRADAVLASLAVASVLAILAMRRTAVHLMGALLRDVSALDRQQLATLEIHPPTTIERIVGKLAGDGALAYSKDARLMRRRYPMAFALGALAFIVLAIVGIAQPSDPAPWMTATIGGATAYAIALARRLQQPPIELPRLSATLPMTAAARARAKLAWVLAWWTVYVLVPGLFAALRQADVAPGLALVGGGTAVTLAVAVLAGRNSRESHLNLRS